jgi:hypothetical protein
MVMVSEILLYLPHRVMYGVHARILCTSVDCTVIIQGMGETLEDQVLSLQMASALALDPCQVSCDPSLSLQPSSIRSFVTSLVNSGCYFVLLIFH